MSNRLMWLLLLLVIIFAGVWFYMYSFVTYTWTVVINTNVEDYNVELQNIKTLNPITTDCSGEKCEIEEVPPFEYKMIISKQWYKKYEETISVSRSEIKSVVFALEKDTKLSVIEPLLVKENNMQTWTILQTGLNTKEILLSKEEKLERLKNKKLYYAYFEITNFWEVYFKKDKTKLNLYLRDELGKEKRITQFNTIARDWDINVQQVFWENSKILITYWEENFLYNSVTASLDKLSLSVPIRYIKTWIGNTLQFVTDKWTFIHKNKKFEYFSMFEDFVYKDEMYIWIVSSDDERRKKNLNFEKESWTLVILQNPETKEKRVLLKPDFEIQNILIIWEDIILTDINWNDYKIENY